MLFAFWFFATLKLGYDPKLWGAGGEVYHNAPLIIYILLAIKGFVAFIALPVLMADPLHRDLAAHTATWLYALPIHEKGYFWGRFLGSFVCLALIIIIASLSILIAPHAAVAFGMLEAERVLGFPLVYLLDGTVKILLPTLFMSAAIVFSLVALTRKYAAALIATIVLFLGAVIAVQLSRYGRNEWLQLFNPTAFHAVHDSTLHWNVSQRNTAFIPFSGMLLYNRLLWVGLGLALLLFTSWRFHFASYLAGPDVRNKQVIADHNEDAVLSHARVFRPRHQAIRLAQWRLLVRQALFELGTVLKEPLFIAIFVLCAAWVVVNNISRQNLPFDALLPVTPATVQSKRALWMLTFISLPFMASTLIYRERTAGIDAIIDSTPAADWIFYGAKLLALCALTFLFPTLVLAGGIITQVAGAYHDFELSLYLTDLYLIYFPFLLQISLFAFGISALVNDRIKGFAISILLLYFSVFGHESKLFEHEMLLQLYETKYVYSAFNGFGAQTGKLFWYNLYWLALSGLVVYAATLFWNRGSEDSPGSRLLSAKRRVMRISWISGLTLSGVCLASGGMIIYNQHILNEYLTGEQHQARRADYELTYGALALQPKPDIAAIELTLELYPERRRADVTASLTLRNSSRSPLQELHLETRDHLTINTLEVIDVKGQALTGQALTPQSLDPVHRHSVYRLPAPIPPGGEAALGIRATLEYKGFTNGKPRLDLIANGILLTENLLPWFNYQRGRELHIEHARRNQGLPLRLPPKQGTAHRLRWDITIGAPAGQTAIAPGRLHKQWTRDGRDYFQYVSSTEERGQLAFLSADYRLERSTWRLTEQSSAALFVFYHPRHKANVQQIIQAAQRALAFLTKAIGPYPYPELRIVETTKATQDPMSYAGLVLIPESTLWTADYRDGRPPDFIDYTLTRALAKHWWKHKLAAGTGKGARVLSEGIPEYLAYRMIEETYGRQRLIDRYLSIATDRYLFFRAAQSEREVPVIESSDDDPYLYRYKAALGLHALARHLGREKLDRLLSEYYSAYAASTLRSSHAGADSLYRRLLAQIQKADGSLLTDYFTRVTEELPQLQ
ncbi:MAG: hypothetical protein ACE5FM_01245 [Methyloligellaceae bacterium]